MSHASDRYLTANEKDWLGAAYSWLLHELANSQPLTPRDAEHQIAATTRAKDVMQRAAAFLAELAAEMQKPL